MSIFGGHEENHDVYEEFNGIHERMLKHKVGSTSAKALAALLSSSSAIVLVIAVVATLFTTTLPSLSARLKSVSFTSADVEIRAELAFSELDYPLQYELYVAGSINYMENDLGVVLHSDIEADPRPVSEKYTLAEPILTGEITGKETFLHFEGLDPGTDYLLLLLPGDGGTDGKYTTELVFTTPVPSGEEPSPTAEPSGAPSSPSVTVVPSVSPSPSPSPSASPSPSPSPSPSAEPSPTPTKAPYYPTPTPSPGITVTIDSDWKEQIYYEGSDAALTQMSGIIDVSELKLQNLDTSYSLTEPTKTDGIVVLTVDGTDLDNTEYSVGVDEYNTDGTVKTLAFQFYAHPAERLSDGGHTLDASVRYLTSSGADTTVEGSDSFTQSTEASPGISGGIISTGAGPVDDINTYTVELGLDVSSLGLSSIGTAESYEALVGCLTVSASGTDSGGAETAMTVRRVNVDSVSMGALGTVSSVTVTVSITATARMQTLTVNAVVTYHSFNNMYSSYMTFRPSASASADAPDAPW